MTRLSVRLLLMTALFLAIASTALASTTWYVNGTFGSDSYSCLSPVTACKTIGHAISLASSGDSIMVAAATYTEDLFIGFNLTITASGALTTVIDGGGRRSVVVAIHGTGVNVTLSGVTVRNGYGIWVGGIWNEGTLKINNSTISGNRAAKAEFGGGAGGRLIHNNWGCSVAGHMRKLLVCSV